jgi:hypothetical protein
MTGLIGRRLSGVACALLAGPALWLVGCGSGSPTTPTPPPIPDTPIQPPPPERPRIYLDEVLVGAGDVGDCAFEGARRTGRLLDGTAGTVFMLGDGAHPQGAIDTYDDCYDPYWGRHRWRTRPVPGNHDYDLPSSPGFFQYFADQLGEGGRTYYTYQLGAWHVYALDSNIASDASSSQYQWLRARLAENTGTCTLAYWHHPVRASSRGGDQPHMVAVWELLAAHGADVVLSSHTHVYERFAPMNETFGFDERGIRLFIAGTGGARHYTFDDIKPLSEVRIEQAWGVLRLTLSNGTYSWDFIPVSGESDSGTGECH